MSAPAADAPEHIPYKILNQEETRQFSPAGTFQEVWRITFQGPNNYVGNVEIPVHEFTPEVVDAKIEEKLDAIMGVHQLGEAPFGTEPSLPTE